MDLNVRSKKDLFKVFLLKKVVVSIVGVWMVAWMATSFLELRHDEFQDPINTMYKLTRMEPMPYLQNVVENNQSLSLLLLSSSYFTSPIPNLDYYFNVGDIPGPFLGGYNFPVVTRNISRLFEDLQIPPWYAVREEVFSPFVANGYLGNVWATLLRDLAVDFTPAGCVVFMGAFGAIVAVMFRRGQRGNFFAHSITVLLSLVVVFSPFTGLFSSVFVSHGILYGLLFGCFHEHGSVDSEFSPPDTLKGFACI